MGLIHALYLAVLLTVCTTRAYKEDYHGHYTNEFAVELHDNVEDIQILAEKHGLRLTRQLSSLGNVYVLDHPTVSHRSKRSAEDVVSKLNEDPRVLRAEQQQVLHRVKRKIVHDKQWELPIKHYDDKSVYQRHYDRSGRLETKDSIPKSTGLVEEAGFDDPFFPDQWYLVNEGQTGGKKGYDVNVLPVWKKGITGRGVVVSILDDGVDHTHPDLILNYDAEASADINDREDSSNDPMPDTHDTSNSHGTRCAGEVAAQANNSNCGVGIAYNSRIGGVRMLDGTITDLLEAEALNYKNQYIDIYSASWGPSDDGKTMESPGTFAREALERGVREGRDGKGSIYVWATGNGGMVEDDCSCDGYVSSIETLSVGCISDQGLSTYFSEVCPSTMAVIFTGGAHSPPGQGDSSDNPKIKVVTTDLDGDCTLEFQGTSSAAPLAAGCFALVLEAKPELNWRDVQHLVVETARIPNSEEEGWTVNGAGHHVNHRFGFGALDCGKMVEIAQDWQTVPSQHRCNVPANNVEIDIRGGGIVNQTLTTEGCRDTPHDRITHLEHVQVHVELTHAKRGDLSISLYSPSGTHSEVLSLRPLDDNSDGINFRFMTVHNWGENPSGAWTLSIADLSDTTSVFGSDGEIRGKLKAWSLTLWGYSDTNSGDPSEKRQEPDTGTETAHEAKKTELKHIMAAEEVSAENLQIAEHMTETDDTKSQNSDTLANPMYNNHHGNMNSKHNRNDESTGNQGWASLSLSDQDMKILENILQDEPKAGGYQSYKAWNNNRQFASQGRSYDSYRIEKSWKDPEYKNYNLFTVFSDEDLDVMDRVMKGKSVSSEEYRRALANVEAQVEITERRALNERQPEGSPHIHQRSLLDDAIDQLIGSEENQEKEEKSNEEDIESQRPEKENQEKKKNSNEEDTEPQRPEKENEIEQRSILDKAIAAGQMNTKEQKNSDHQAGTNEGVNTINEGSESEFWSDIEDVISSLDKASQSGMNREKPVIDKGDYEDILEDIDDLLEAMKV